MPNSGTPGGVQPQTGSRCRALERAGGGRGSGGRRSGWAGGAVCGGGRCMWGWGVCWPRRVQWCCGRGARRSSDVAETAGNGVVRSDRGTLSRPHLQRRVGSWSSCCGHRTLRVACCAACWAPALGQAGVHSAVSRRFLCLPFAGLAVAEGDARSRVTARNMYLVLMVSWRCLWAGAGGGWEVIGQCLKRLQAGCRSSRGRAQACCFAST